MNSFIRFICALSVVMVTAFSASATNIFNPADFVPVERTVIGEDIVHYIFKVTVDTGPYDKIRLHRFIREPADQPIPNLEGILLLPGASSTIMGIFGKSLNSQDVAWDHSILIYLAKNNIDVWGMDYAWSLVPAKRKDFDFMKDWTIAKDARHAADALSFARTIRESTGQGTSKLNLLGFSYGVPVGFSILSDETQRSEGKRNVQAFIPVDEGLKYSASDSALRAEACAMADSLQSALDSGTYAENVGLWLSALASLAESNPEGPSDTIPGLTNYQALLYIAGDPQASWHLSAVYFDKDGLPIDFRFTNPGLAVDALQALSPYWPVKAEWEEYSLPCDEVNVPGFEHIDQIKVPILYVGAAGGYFGEHGYYTLTLTASEDISKFNVQLLPDKKRGFDFGHADLFTADDAETLVWKPILNWINTH